MSLEQKFQIGDRVRMSKNVEKTKEDLKRLASGMELLATLIEEGVAPPFGDFTLYDDEGNPCCAMGHAFDLAEFEPLVDAADAFDALTTLDLRLPGLPWEVFDRIQGANDAAPPEERHLATVEPLRRGAEELRDFVENFKMIDK